MVYYSITLDDVPRGKPVSLLWSRTPVYLLPTFEHIAGIERILAAHGLIEECQVVRPKRTLGSARS